VSEQQIKHLAFIMDGNRRWAKANNLPTLEGHRRGYDVMVNMAKWCSEKGIKVLTVYAFSSDNWNRSEEEVGYLMDLFRMIFDSAMEEVAKINGRVIMIGQKERFPKDLQELIKKAEEKTKNNTGIIFQVGLSYGGRPDIIQAVKRIINDKIEPEKVTEEFFSSYLWTVDVPDPDLIVRTSHEFRLSNFLTWQSAYSELLFLEKNWPEITEADLDQIIEEFSQRQRRFGK